MTSLSPATRRLPWILGVAAVPLLVAAPASASDFLVTPSPVAADGTVQVSGHCDPGAEGARTAVLFDGVIVNADHVVGADLAFTRSIPVSGLVGSSGQAPAVGDEIVVGAVCIDMQIDTSSHIQVQFSPTTVGVTGGSGPAPDPDPDPAPDPTPDPAPDPGAGTVAPVDNGPKGSKGPKASKSPGQSGAPATNRGTAFDTGVSAVQRPGGADGGISGAGLALGVAGGVGGLWVVWHVRRRARC